MTNPKDPAFVINLNPDGEISIGLTKREYFAAMALGRLMTDSSALPHYWNETNRKEVAESAVKMADALIMELNK